MAAKAIKAVEVFYSYAHEDEALCKQLEKHLSSLRQQGYIRAWHDREIAAGTDWAQEISVHLESATIILLLISPDFMQSDYCMGIEVKRAMERYDAGEAHVIPVLLRSVDFKGAPFARLQVLPGGAVPIELWPSSDEALKNVSQGIRDVVENLDLYLHGHDRAHSRDYTRLPGDPTSYFLSLDHYLQPSQTRFPTRHDFEQGLIYNDVEYIKSLQALSQEKRRVLLAGPAAAGKTVLAIILARQLQEQAGYRVAYRDVDRARSGEGLIWYSIMMAHDHAGTLYILDNCHLAPQEVSELCLQWEEQAPEHTQCILISRAHTGEVEEEAKSIYYYFEACSTAMIKIQAAHLYRGILEQYATYYQKRDAARFTALQEDSAELLKKQHASNLIISKIRLDAWGKQGGRLSEVRKEAVYQALIERYLAKKQSALPMLCALRQFEILAHNVFVEDALPLEEVKRLEEESLLTGSVVHNYGLLYDLALHPSTAQEIYKASIYRRFGHVTWPLLRQRLLADLRTYLQSVPSNFSTVYRNLARQRQKNILHSLLADPQLQACAASRFDTAILADAIDYLFRLSALDAARARELLAQFMQAAGEREISSSILYYTFQERTIIIQQLRSIDADVAQTVVSLIAVDQWARQAEGQSLHSLFNVLQLLRAIAPNQARELLHRISLQALLNHCTVNNLPTLVEQLEMGGYTRAQVISLLEVVDIDYLARQSLRGGIQHLVRLLRLFKEYVPVQGRHLLESIPPTMLADRAMGGSVGIVAQIFEYMHVVGCAQSYSNAFIGALNMDALLVNAEDENLQHLFWCIRALDRLSHEAAQRLLFALTPVGLAELCHAKKVTISMVEQFHKVTGRSFWRQFLQQFSVEDMVEIFQRSSLHAIGAFLRPRYFYFKYSYRVFRQRHLVGRLETEGLDEVSKFLYYIRQIPEVGEELAEDTLYSLVKIGLVERVKSSDLRAYAYLLQQAVAIHSAYLPSLMLPIEQSGLLQAALKASSPESIEFLRVVVERADNSSEKRYLRALQQEILLISHNR